MKAVKKYYLKWNIEEQEFLLDASYLASNLTYGIRQVLVTPEQAELFSEIIEDRYISRKKYIDMNLLEFEFDKQFHICKCGIATHHSKWAKRYGKECYECYLLSMSARFSESRKKVVERDRIIRLQKYIKTEQGRADIIGLKAIKVNIQIQLKKHNKTQTELAGVLGIGIDAVSDMLNKNKSIRIEYLYKICEWLFVPMDLMLKVPRGTLPLKKKHNIPIAVYHKPIKIIR